MSLVLIEALGISPRILATVLGPILSLPVFVVAYCIFRRVTGRREWALLGVYLLTLFPYFSLITEIGTLDKFVITLMLLFIWSTLGLAKDRTYTRRWPETLISILATLTLAVINVYFATLFAFVLLLTALANRAIQLGTSKPRTPTPVPHLGAAAIALAATSVVVFYVYPPATSLLYIARDWTARLQQILFGGASFSGAAYGYVGLTYRSPAVYLLLSLYQWSMILASVFMAGLLVLSLRRRESRREMRTWLVFYVAFAVWIVASIPFDLATGGNFQLRIFALITPLIPALPGLVSEAYSSARVFHKRKIRITIVAAAIAILVIGMPTSLLASSNEPSLSNTWMFYSPAEAAGITWMQSRLPASTSVFLGYGQRLESAYDLNAPIGFARSPSFSTPTQSCYIFWSSVEQSQVLQSGESYHILNGSQSKIYDANGASVYMASDNCGGAQG